MAQRLLLADDSVTIQKVIELTFADERIEVVAVSGGAAAITRLSAEPFDIVLADAGMPGVNGFDVATFVRDRPAGRIPVILLTGAFDPVDDSRVAAVGASAVLAKPFEPQVLVAKVRELLESGPVTPGVSQVHAQDVTASPADVLLNAPPGAADASPSVDDYFERLDRAFAGLTAPLEPRDPLKPSASRTPASGQPATMAPPVVPEPPSPPAARVASESTMSSPASSDNPRSDSGPGGDAPPSGLAGTFATLLAVEQGELPPSALTPPATGADAELVDRIARRVVEQISARAVREMAADIVSRTAERLVREEIDRIKAGLGS
jgi:CheY-like chemotaxis protein